jgi:hypothetical protein
VVLDAHKPLDEMKRVSMPSPRRLPPPLALDEMNNACFIVRDRNGQALAYVAAFLLTSLSGALW